MNEFTKAQMLDQFEINLRIQLPQGLKQLLLESRELEEYTIPEVDEFVALKEYRGTLPMRFVPLFREPSGDVNGFYYPRGSELVIFCYFSIGQETLIPQTTDFQSFFQDPDKYSPDHPDNDDEVPQESSEYWQSLLYDFDALCPELELLKSFGLNANLDAEMDLELLSKLVSRFGQSDNGDETPTQSIIRDKYESPLALLDRHWWMEIAEIFVQHKLWQPAIIALENCEAVHRVYPYEGYALKGKSEMRWVDIREVQLKLQPLVAAHGDALDKATLARKLEITTSYARDEERDARWYPK